MFITFTAFTNVFVVALVFTLLSSNTSFAMAFSKKVSVKTFSCSSISIEGPEKGSFFDTVLVNLVVDETALSTTASLQHSSSGLASVTPSCPHTVS